MRYGFEKRILFQGLFFPQTGISNVAALFATNNEYLEERLSWDSWLKDVFMFDRVVGILEKSHIQHIPGEEKN